jgi:glucan phosphoethanolaminetransferase (alkaline phosphatase superfamily)
MTQKQKVKIFLSLYILIFAISTTNIIPIFEFLFYYFIVLILIFFVLFLLRNRFRIFIIVTIVCSVLGVFTGFATYGIYGNSNFEKAQKLIMEIEDFKKAKKRFPKNETEINLPISRNGFYVEKFYYYPNNNENDYVIKYFDGFWNTKVYVSNSKKWYTDD